MQSEAAKRLLERWDNFNAGNANYEEAYNNLAKYAYDDWEALRAALSTDADPVKTSRFGHHPEPAIDFCIEVEALEGHLFDAKHGIGKPGHEPRKLDDDFRRRVSTAMDFIVGGDQIAIAAKATLRSIAEQIDAEPVKTAPAVAVKAGPLAHALADELERMGQPRPNGDILHDALSRVLPALSAQVQDVAGKWVAPDDATDEMVAAALKVDWSNDNETATVHNVWHAMRAAFSASKHGDAE